MVLFHFLTGVLVDYEFFESRIDDSLQRGSHAKKLRSLSYDALKDNFKNASKTSSQAVIDLVN